MPELPETAPELAGVLRELIDREPIFHRSELGTTRMDFERMTADDFWEVGASGRQYSRGFVLDALEERHRSPQSESFYPSDFRCRALGNTTYLLTYTLMQGERKTRRATIWERAGEAWVIVYHQGTIVSVEAGLDTA